MSTAAFVGGSLKLKGGKALPVKGGIKKKKKKKTGTELAVIEGNDSQQAQQEGQQQDGVSEGLPTGVKKVLVHRLCRTTNWHQAPMPNCLFHLDLYAFFQQQATLPAARTDILALSVSCR